MQIRDALSARLDGEDPGVDEAALYGHLAGCAKCRAFAHDADALHRRVRLEPAPAIPDLAPAVLVEQARRLEDVFAAEHERRHRLKLITRRAVTTHNSWTHNLADFVESDRGTNYLYMHPDDAGRAGLRDDDLCDVTSPTATVRVPV
jgi:anaerobic selenocysteine-containing dehydrogenase